MKTYTTIRQHFPGSSARRDSLLRQARIAAVCIVLAGASMGILRAGQSSGGAKASSAAAHGAVLASLDKTCKPCEDFYHYASGAWLAKNPVPEAYPSWNSFSQLAERNRQHLREILEAEAENPHAALGSNEQKIGDFYASCMDEKDIDAAGVQPLGAEFARINGVASLADLQAEIARLQGMGVRAPFEFGSTQDAKNSSEVIGGAEQAGLGLPDRDYYTKTDDKSKHLLQQYEGHIAKMLALTGIDASNVSDEAKAIVELESKLANASMTTVDRRDPDKTYHRMNRGELQALTPNWAWGDYLQEIGYTHIEAVDVSEPDFFAAVSRELKNTPLGIWKEYLRWQFLNSSAAYLSQPFVDENFNFNGRVLQGTKELLPRWKRCVSASDRRLGEALGQIYVQKYFPPQAKARVLQMINNLMEALRDDLQSLPWMSPATRKEALVKLSAFTLKIGYPDKWRDYSAYSVDRGPYVRNMLRGAEFEFHRDLNKIGKPVDRTEWSMSPPTVNAYNNWEMNEIVFPAGILQPPFFDPDADDASNYGAIGSVIGHEMTHSFDDKGRKFDDKGNLRDWWTPEDEKNFNERASCVEKQFDGYVVQDDLHENGKLELGESIADLGGLKLAYRALQKQLKGKKPALIGGLTAEQRFFVSYAQLWASNDRPEYERLVLNTDPHPLGRFRAIAPPSNMPQFAKAFDCKEGQTMARPAAIRCQIW